MSDNQTTTGGQPVPPIIDLSNMSLGDLTATSGSSGQGQTGQTTSAQTPLSPAVAGSKPASFDLESAAMAAQNQAMLAPPDKFAVPDMVKQKFPDLVDLIKATESMSDDERDYWFQILPIMTEEQIGKFREILLNEKMQLSKLDREYEQELSKLNEKHMIEWKEFETKEKRKSLVEAEQQSSLNEKAKEEDLLAQLASL